MKKIIVGIIFIFFSTVQLFSEKNCDKYYFPVQWEKEDIFLVTNNRGKLHELSIYEKSEKTSKQAKKLFNDLLLDLLEIYKCESIVISDWHVILFLNDEIISLQIEDKKLVQATVLRKIKESRN